MNEVLFRLAFLVAAPFWALMIFAPTWRWTARIGASPAIALPVVAVALVLYGQVFGDLLALVTNPTLAKLQAFVDRPAALAGLWAQVLAWDLLIGRWIYLDSRERGVPPLLASVVLFATVLLSPVAYPIYLVIRSAYRQAPGRVLVGSPS